MEPTDQAAVQNTKWGHASVLVEEVIAGLDLKPGEIFLDGTLGSGGHSEEVIKRFGTKVRIIALDADADAIERSRKRLEGLGGNVDFIQENFRNLDKALESLNIASVDKILLDLGFSSNQMEESGRGFSFQRSEPLVMTFKKHPDDADVTAREIVNEWSEESLATVIWGFGGERYARRIASGIVQARVRKPIVNTQELVDIILQATPRAYHRQPIHPATRTFQALRIAANDELKALEEGLHKGFEQLASGGRIAVISFHSLEDRIVKNFFRNKENAQEGSMLVKKPITAAEMELKANRRARSAKLRIFIKN